MSDGKTKSDVVELAQQFDANERKVLALALAMRAEATKRLTELAVEQRLLSEKGVPHPEVVQQLLASMFDELMNTDVEVARGLLEGGGTPT